MLKYRREFICQSAHFNGGWCYDRYFACLDKGEPVPLDIVKVMIAEIHGHNFKIVVEVEGEPQDGTFWLIEDEELEKIVRVYDNRNLSVMEEFVSKRTRATTELMACHIAQTVKSVLPTTFAVTVEVWESDNIVATWYELS